MNSVLHLALGLVVMLPFAALAQDCVRNEDCPFMGSCDQVTLQCVCKIDCQDYQPLPNEKATYYCTSQQLWPLTLCKALSNACETGTNLLMKTYDPDDFQVFGQSCRKIPYDGAEELCEDQSFCQGNGICYRSRDNKSGMLCRCNRYYSGERCAVRTLAVASESHILVGDGNQQPSKGSESMLGKIAPYLALGVLSAVLGCCLVSQYVKRRNEQKNSEGGQSGRQPDQVLAPAGKPDQTTTVTVEKSNRSSGSESPQTIAYKAPVPIVVACQTPVSTPGARRARL